MSEPIDMEIEGLDIKMREINNIFRILSENMVRFITNSTRESLNIDDDSFEKLVFFSQVILASGMQGYVVKTLKDLFIIKISRCEASEKNENCERIRKNIIYNIPQLKNETLVSLPDTVSENVIGYLFNNISSYTPNFVKNYGMIWRGDRTYSFVEKLKTNVFSPTVLKKGENLVIAILQYLHGLSVAQQTYKFTHNDSHLLNILYKDEGKTDWDKVYLNVCNDSFSTKHTTREFYVKNPGWNIKINDYGLSRITDSKSRKSYVGISNAMRNYNKFSHCVDYLTLFGCIFYLGFTFHNSDELTRNMTQLRAFINENRFLNDLARLNGFSNPYFLFFSVICPSLFKTKMSDEQLRTNMNMLYDNKNYYRPSNNYIFLYSHLFETPDSAFINLANLLYPSNVNIVSTVQAVQNNIKKYNNYTVLYSNIPVRKNIAIDKTIKISDDIIYKRFEYADKKSEYNIGDNIDSCDLNQIVHVCRISASAMNNGFNFISECCGIEPSDIFEKENKFGVAINGVFFDILKSNFPIGYYKDKNIDGIYHKIPEEYRDYYAIIGFNNNKGSRNLLIEPLREVKEDIANIAKRYSFLAVSGPILIYNDLHFSEKQVSLTKDNINIFQCVNPPTNDTNKVLNPGIPITICKNSIMTRTQTVKRHPNCKTISAGELSHGGNLNPRTAIAYNQKDNSLYFIVIEGRNKRGSGQDFVKMTNIIKSIDNNIIRAVNLDGGGSSSMIFREVGKQYISIVNPVTTSPYPVGNVFGVISNK
jgi:hypothetical protein